jgi:hypothetical protein
MALLAVLLALAGCSGGQPTIGIHGTVTVCRPVVEPAVARTRGLTRA